ncbi:MAG TPA: pentapeptide repeat-containing protein [Gemmatimonadales bacterium]|nr:pentapeptide repeat-containing protein [Gemmatimonadales bacterium]
MVDTEATRPARQSAGYWPTALTAIAAAVTVAVLALTAAYTERSNRNQLDLAEQGQITDRFSKAIDQLGREDAKDLSLRLGGIYALERIMRDSDDDEAAIVEVLSAFVREHTRIGAKPIRNPTTDVQAALTVLGRRPNADQRGFGTDAGFGIIDLRDAPPQEVHLEKASLQGAHLEGALLKGAHLDAANLRVAHLEGADLEGTVLNGADLEGAHFEKARLKNTYVGGTDLSKTTGLTTESVREVCADKDTTFPPGVTGPTGTIEGC